MRDNHAYLEQLYTAFRSWMLQAGVDPEVASELTSFLMILVGILAVPFLLYVIRTPQRWRLALLSEELNRLKQNANGSTPDLSSSKRETCNSNTRGGPESDAPTLSGKSSRTAGRSGFGSVDELQDEIKRRLETLNTLLARHTITRYEYDKKRAQVLDLLIQPGMTQEFEEDSLVQPQAAGPWECRCGKTNSPDSSHCECGRVPNAII